MNKLLILLLFTPFASFSQIDEDQLGAWYMYFFNGKLQETPWGAQGDIQYRNWDLGGDLEQLLLRGGITYSPKGANILFTQGYGHIATGGFGKGSGTDKENRIYQEALIPHKLNNRFVLAHRFRFEQRWVDFQDFRTRYRYNLFLNIPLSKKELGQGVVYIALYNELFINGQRSIGNNRTVELFDRNRSYAALGYQIKKGFKTQLGFMRQTTDNWTKNQVQLSLHHNF